MFTWIVKRPVQIGPAALHKPITVKPPFLNQPSKGISKSGHSKEVVQLYLFIMY